MPRPESSIRVNISLPVLCFDEVNKVIEKTGLFNGRTDFVYSAIRSLMMKLTDLFKDKLDDIIEANKTPLETHLLIRDYLHEYGKHENNRFSLLYSGPYVKQIPIRMDEDFYDSMVIFAKYIDESNEQILVQNFCHIAIMEHLEEISVKLTKLRAFGNELRKIKDKSTIYVRGNLDKLFE